MTDYMSNLLKILNDMIEANDFTVPSYNGVSTIKYRGYYKLQNLKIFLEKKPNILKRLFMNFLLGFKWEDYNNNLNK